MSAPWGKAAGSWLCSLGASLECTVSHTLFDLGIFRLGSGCSHGTHVWGLSPDLGGPDPTPLKNHFHTLVPELLQGPPWRSPQEVSSSSVGPSGWPGVGTPRPWPSGAGGPVRAAPGAGRGRRWEAPPRGRGGGQRGLGAGPAGGRGGVPPSLALSGKVSRCCRAQPRLLLLLPRPGGGDCAPTSARAAPPRPPASMATTATCTRFTDDYQLFEELGKYGPPATRGGPPPWSRRPGALRLLAPPPGPAPAAAAPPRPAPPPAFPACCLGGPLAPGSRSRSPLRALQQLPGCCTRRRRGNCSPGTAPGRLPAPPLPHPSDAPLPRPRLSTAPSPPSSGAHSAPAPQFPRARHSGPSPALQFQPRCGAGVWGDV